MLRGASNSALADTARQASLPPAPAPHVPHPLAELPPEAKEGIPHKDQDENFGNGRHVATKPGPAGAPRAIKPQSGEAKKAANNR